MRSSAIAIWVIVSVGLLGLMGLASQPIAPPALPTVAPTNVPPTVAERRAKSVKTMADAPLVPPGTGGIRPLPIIGDGNTIPQIWTMPTRPHNGPIAIQVSYDAGETWQTVISNEDTQSNQRYVLTMSYLTNAPSLLWRVLEVKR